MWIDIFCAEVDHSGDYNQYESSMTILRPLHAEDSRVQKVLDALVRYMI